MAIKKSDLYSSLWASCDELRGGMDERLPRSDFPDFNDPNKLGEGQAMVDRLTGGAYHPHPRRGRSEPQAPCGPRSCTVLKLKLADNAR